MNIHIGFKMASGYFVIFYSRCLLYVNLLMEDRRGKWMGMDRKEGWLGNNERGVNGGGGAIEF